MIEITPSRNTVTIIRNTAVCDRTEQVRDAIMAAVPEVTDCADVTDAHLAAVTKLNLRSGSIMALAVGDFAGLTSLKWLLLDENQLMSLPDSVFAGLTSLKWLLLEENQLTSLPDGVFAGLTSLETLHLDENQLTSLPDGVFAGLTSLKRLYLHGNQLTSLPDDVFAGLTSLEWLWLYENQLTSLSDGIFAGLASLKWLLLGDNQLSALPDGVFAGLTSLERLVLDGNRLTSLPDGVFAGLTSLEALWLSKNQLTSLPDGVFAGLTSLGTLGMTKNRLTSLPDGVFAGLAALETLVLYRNQLSTLSADVFEGLTSLEMLVLHGNQLTSLPDGIFAGLTSLETLVLHSNQLTSLPDGVFAGLTSLETLNLSWNATDPLPLVVTLEKVGESRFKAVARTGAPFEFVLPVSAANGSIEGDSTAIRIPAGAVESGPLGITRATGTTAAVTVDIDSVPDLPSGHSGYALEKDSSLPQTILLSASTGMTLSLSPDRVGEGDGATTLTVTATLNGIALKADTAVALTVRALTADTTDFAASTATLTISSGQTSGTADVTLTPADDDVDEGDETVAVEGAVAGLTVTADTVTIADDDTRGVDVSATALAVSEGDSAAYTVALESAPTDTVMIAVSVTGDSDVTASPDTLTFTKADWSTAQTVTVRAAADADAADDTATVSHAVSGGDYGANNVAADTVAVTVDDDETAPTALSVADADASEEEDAAVEFVVTLNPAASDTVTVDYATSDGTATAGEDYTATSGTLTFAAGDTTKTVSVPIIDDTVDDGGETFTLTLSNASGAALGDAEATGTIRNTETTAKLSVADAEASEEDDTAVEFVVTLAPASSDTVTVDYATSDGTAAAGSDYTATSGTLTFAAGDTTKTVSVPIADDTVDDGGETFTLTLSNASGAALGDAEATGTIRNTEAAAELSASFPESAFTSKRHTGSDDRPQVVVAFSEAVAEFAANTPSVSVTGASGLSVQAHTEDGLENAYVFFMTPDGDGDVTFALTTNAACASGGICTAGGTVLTQVPGPRTIPGPDDESLPAVSVSDASAAEGDAVAFTVSLSAASSQQVTVEYATSGGTATSGTDFTAESGTLTFAANETSKTVSVATTDDSVDEENETFTLTLSSPANATLGDATATGTINDNDVSTTPLTASFSNMPASHTGEEFTFGLAFSEEVELSYVTLRDTAFVVTGGEVKTAQRQQQGSNQAWNITVEPDGQGAVTIMLPETTDCRAADAICTLDERPLSHSLSSVVAGPVIIPAVSVSDASAAEGDAVAFTVSLSAATSQQVTVAYATSDGTATAGSDYTAESGTLTFAANETSNTVSVATTDDSVDEDDETFTLTLSSPANATLGDATATGTINDDDSDNAAPLTANFSNMPASHTGEEFTFGLTFSENVELSYVTLRDTAFVVTGGEVKTAQRQQQGSNQAWNITVKPTSASDTVTITLPETTDCDAVDAICTHDGRPLSHSLSATVVDAASSSAGDAVGGIVADDALDAALALADGVTPEEATQALFGERRLSEAQLTAFDRLGNRNGGYDLGDVLSWVERCRRGEARCGTTPTDSGPASSAALLGAAAAGRRRTSKQLKRGDSGHRGSLPIRGMRRRARKAGYGLAMLLAATMAWSCTDGSVGPVAPAAAVQDPGFLTIEWTGPAAARDIGVLIELEGPGIEAVRAPGLDLYESSAPGRHQVVVAGSLRAGPLVQFKVPDRGQLPLYRVRVVQVTGEDYALSDVGEYRAVITSN